MRLSDFEKSVQRFIPRFHIKQRTHGDVAALHIGDKYLGFRVSKGDLPLYTWHKKVMKDDYHKYVEMRGGQFYPGNMKRGRMAVLQMMVSKRYLTVRQSQKVMWGL